MSKHRRQSHQKKRMPSYGRPPLFGSLAEVSSKSGKYVQRSPPARATLRTVAAKAAARWFATQLMSSPSTGGETRATQAPAASSRSRISWRSRSYSSMVGTLGIFPKTRYSQPSTDDSIAFRSLVPTRTVTCEGRHAMTSSRRFSTFLTHCMFTPALMTALRLSSPEVKRCRSSATQSAERLPRVRLSPRQTTGDRGSEPSGGPVAVPSRKALGVSSSSATATLMMVREAKTMDHPTTLTTGSLTNSSTDSQILRATCEAPCAEPALRRCRGLAPPATPPNAAPRPPRIPSGVRPGNL
mmetsp:Transcript_60230/g.179376  ORF Transcript_60230/g.179376 Transcript_60230/m.179376 type:complete len:298 (-) Transcript_60230:261-1154(-)